MYYNGLGAYRVGSGQVVDALGAYAFGFGVAEAPPEPPAGDGVLLSPRSAPFNRALREYPAALIREYPK